MKTLSEDQIRKLIKRNRVQIRGTWFLNTTPHELHIGSGITLTSGKGKIVDLFTVEKIYYQIGYVGLYPMVEVKYEPKYKKIRDLLVRCLEDLDTYALGSIVTVKGFNSRRVLKIDPVNHILVKLPENDSLENKVVSVVRKRDC